MSKKKEVIFYKTAEELGTSPDDAKRQLMLYEYAMQDYLHMKWFFEAWEFAEYLRELNILFFYARIEPWGA